MATQPNDGSDGVTAQVQQKAEELMERAGESARTRIDDGKQQAARELNSVAHALRNCGTDLESDRTALLTPYVNRVADEVERFSRYIDSHSPQDIARNVEGFARRNPAVFLGGCFALGMVAARFLKSSRPDLPVPLDYYRSPDWAGYTPQPVRPPYDAEGSVYSEPVSSGRQCARLRVWSRPRP